MNDLPPWPEQYEPHDYAHMHDLIAALRARNARLVETLSDAVKVAYLDARYDKGSDWLVVIEACKEPT